MKKQLVKIFEFCGSHHLPWHQGKCQNLHGHTWKLEVKVEGEVNQNGVVIDFHTFKEIVNDNVINRLDHKNLNDIIPNPTAENLLDWIYSSLPDFLQVIELKLWESNTSCAILKIK